MVTKTEPIRPPPLPGIFGVPGSGSRIAWEPVPHNTRQKSGPVREPAEKIVKDLRRMTRRKFSAEEKIRIVIYQLVTVQFVYPLLDVSTCETDLAD
jgi:hypothetical protein